MNLFNLPLNLNQGIIHTNKPDTVNTVVAIYDRHIEKMVVRPEYTDVIDNIHIQFPFTNTFRVEYGDGFSVNTWDEKL